MKLVTGKVDLNVETEMTSFGKCIEDALSKGLRVIAFSGESVLFNSPLTCGSLTIIPSCKLPVTYCYKDKNYIVPIISIWPDGLKSIDSFNNMLPERQKLKNIEELIKMANFIGRDISSYIPKYTYSYGDMQEVLEAILETKGIPILVPAESDMNATDELESLTKSYIEAINNIIPDAIAGIESYAENYNKKHDRRQLVCLRTLGLDNLYPTCGSGTNPELSTYPLGYELYLNMLFAYRTFDWKRTV